MLGINVPDWLNELVNKWENYEESLRSYETARLIVIVLLAILVIDAIFHVFFWRMMNARRPVAATPPNPKENNMA